jgi:hypothetical protein
MGCNLTKLFLDPVCDFKGKAGDQLTLTLVGTVGNVQFEAAKYGGTALAGLPATEITFTLHDGRIPLDVVYTFSSGTNGRGKLHEKCPSNTLLDDWVRGDNPVTRYVICTTSTNGGAA